MNTAGLILAGGKSGRLGAHKFQTLLENQTLLDRVVARLSPQVGTVGVNLPRYCTDEEFTVLHEPEGEAVGPLAGVLLGLQWAQSVGVDALVTMPVDVPFFPIDFVQQLSQAQVGAQPICAAEDGRRHGLCALWPVACLPEFSTHLLENDVRIVNRMLDLLQAQETVFEAENHSQFFNVNTAEDIEIARQLLLEAKDREHDKN